MIDIRYVRECDVDFWFGLDSHISQEQFFCKVRDGQGYVLEEDGIPCAVLRYNLFWDSIPFCTMLFVDDAYRKKGYGKAVMEHWENDMLKKGHKMVIVSTQSDETAQHFYRKLGYSDAGVLLLNVPGYVQPSELFFTKQL